MCGKIGTHSDNVPMPIAGRVRSIDRCIAKIVAALNAGGIETIESCCGHGLLDGSVSLEDGRVLMITTLERAQQLGREQRCMTDPDYAACIAQLESEKR